ncbi:class I SAM-dependent methyltransferase [Halalkalibaculum sp. DA3122]|uniref:class I SAM-dependent methyltransferase n=1 Tax=unclassified Halalkalibaculum TaxID=2964617 RepID=UPI003754E1C3
MRPDQISRTAAFVAIKFYGLTRIPPYHDWFDQEIIQFYERLVQYLPPPLNWYHQALQKSWLRKFFIISEELLLPGDLMHILMRKYIIGQKVEQLLSRDYTQLLVMGAGFDHLAAFHSQGRIPCFEIDAPRMSSIKQNFVTQQGMQNTDLHIISHHFSSRGSGLNLEQLDPNRDTVIVAEGFFDYLDQHQSQQILEDLETFFRNRVQLISTIFALDELSAARRAIFTAGVRMVGEKIRLHLSKNEFESMLAAASFTPTRAIDSTNMLQKLPAPRHVDRSVLNGFYLSFSEK